MSNTSHVCNCDHAKRLANIIRSHGALIERVIKLCASPSVPEHEKKRMLEELHGLALSMQGCP